MVDNPPKGMQRVIPYLLYADADAAIRFLCRAFAFEERYRMAMPGGKVGHAEISYEDNVIMLASVFEDMGHASPKDLPSRHSQIVCYVDDVDEHFERAKAVGAEIIAEPADQFYGDRTYRAMDPEGHEWNFHTHVRDVAPEDMKPPTG